MGERSLEAFLAPLRGKPWLKVDASPGRALQMGEDEFRWRLSRFADDATARTLELVAEWLRERSTVCQKAGNHYRANALSDHADLIERGAFSDWLKAREARGG